MSDPSERIYARLLHLFPPQFQEKYEQEALQLFRDRVRDGTGLYGRLRLWLNLITDLCMSVPHQYRHARATSTGSSTQQHFYGTPSFRVLAGVAVRPRSLLLGGVFATLAFAGFSAVNGLPTGNRYGQKFGISGQHSVSRGVLALASTVSSRPTIPDSPAGRFSELGSMLSTAMTPQQ